jgi:hypothetical protein
MTANAPPNPSRESTLRREITSDLANSLIAISLSPARLLKSVLHERLQDTSANDSEFAAARLEH